MKKLYYILQRDINNSYENNIFSLVSFFFLIIFIFCLSISNDINLINKFGISILWTTTTLTCFLYLERWMHEEYFNGSIELLKIQSISFEFLILLKSIINSISISIPIILTMPILFLIFNINYKLIFIFIKMLLILINSIIFIGLVGISLTLGLKHKSIIISLVLLPMYLPIYILSINLINLYSKGIEDNSYIFIIVSLSLIISITSTWISSKLL